MMRSKRLVLASALLGIVGSSAWAQVSLTGGTWEGDWNLGGINNPGTFTYGPLSNDGTKPGVLKVTEKRAKLSLSPENAAGQTYYEVWSYTSLKIGSTAVWAHDPRISWNFGLLVDSNREGKPSTNVTQGLGLYEVDDKDGSGSYGFGETIFNPALENLEVVASQDGAVNQIFQGSKTFGGSTLMKANSVYAFVTKTRIETTLDDEQWNPLPTVELDIFADPTQLEWQISYEPVPEPASMAALAAGLAFVARRRKRS